ncbi:hypothetical protein D3C73_943740 [compost metagenome]
MVTNLFVIGHQGLKSQSFGLEVINSQIIHPLLRSQITIWRIVLDVFDKFGRHIVNRLKAYNLFDLQSIHNLKFAGEIDLCMFIGHIILGFEIHPSNWVTIATTTIYAIAVFIRNKTRNTVYLSKDLRHITGIGVYGFGDALIIIRQS